MSKLEISEEILKNIDREELIKLWRSQPSIIIDSPTLEDVIKVLQEELSKDKSEGSYYYSWQANIAMQFVDTFENMNKKGEIDIYYSPEEIHKVANQASKNFLDLLIKQ